MQKIIWMSDPHFAQEGLVLGHDPRVRLQAAIKHVNDHHGDAGMCIISGDMVNRGTQADYAGLRTLLDTLVIPYFPMAGNHDNRDLLRSILPLPQSGMAEFIQYKSEMPEGLMVCLDTQKAGSDAGEFCPARKSWLQATLREAGQSPVFVFMHHPPMALGLPMQDTDRMENGEEFLALISAFDCVKYLFIGHVHRPISGTAAGIPFSTMRSILYQVPPPRPAWNWDTFRPSPEAPNLGIIEIENGSVNLQYEQFCAYEAGVVAPSDLG